MCSVNINNFSICTLELISYQRGAHSKLELNFIKGHSSVVIMVPVLVTASVLHFLTLCKNAKKMSFFSFRVTRITAYSFCKLTPCTFYF